MLLGSAEMLNSAVLRLVRLVRDLLASKLSGVCRQRRTASIPCLVCWRFAIRLLWDAGVSLTVPAPKRWLQLESCSKHRSDSSLSQTSIFGGGHHSA